MKIQCKYVHWIHLAQAFWDVMLRCWDEGTTHFPHLRTYTTNNSASHARQPGPPETLLLEPQTSDGNENM